MNKAMFGMADQIENSMLAIDRIHQLIVIVITEVFDECRGSEGDFYGKLGKYEQSFESVLTAADDLALEQINKLKNIAEQLYKLSKEDKQPE